MITRGLLSLLLGVAASGAGMACSSSSASPGLSFVSLNSSAAGVDAGCTIATGGNRIGCAEAFRISGQPAACPGFDDAGVGTMAECRQACMSSVGSCKLSGLSDGTNAVECQLSCSSPEH
jgi:hypothetical protein